MEDAKIVRCKNCQHWTLVEVSPTWVDGKPETCGKCIELKCADRIDINLITGWDGGYIDSIITTENFFCACGKEKIT